MPVDPGHHVIDVTAPGKKPFHQEVDVAGQAAAARVDVALEDAPAPPPENNVVVKTVIAPPPPQDAGRGNGVRIVGLTTAGVGVASVVVGAIFGAMAIGKKSDAANNCTPDLSTCNVAGKASIDDAFTFASISTVTFIAGGVLAALGVTVFLVAPHAKDTVAVSMGPMGVSVGGRF
jgi:hypothetical protein